MSNPQPGTPHRREHGICDVSRQVTHEDMYVVSELLPLLLLKSPVDADLLAKEDGLAHQIQALLSRHGICEGVGERTGVWIAGDGELEMKDRCRGEDGAPIGRVPNNIAWSRWAQHPLNDIQGSLRVESGHHASA